MQKRFTRGGANASLVRPPTDADVVGGGQKVNACLNRWSRGGLQGKREDFDAIMEEKAIIFN